jgi:hypothetical protein
MNKRVMCDNCHDLALYGSFLDGKKEWALCGVHYLRKLAATPTIKELLKRKQSISMPAGMCHFYSLNTLTDGEETP